MAKLPSVSSSRTLTNVPQSSISPGEVADPFHAMGRSLDRAGQSFAAAMHEEAAQEGESSIYRDESGQLQVDLRSNLSGTGRAYNRAAQQAYTARLTSEIASQGSVIAREAGNDVEAFQKAWKSFAKGMVKNTPESIRGPIEMLMETEGDRFAKGIIRQKHEIDIRTQEADLLAVIKAKDDEGAALARGGGVGTSSYQEIQQQIASLYNELILNPEFSMSGKQAEIAINRMQSRHTGEAIVGSIDNTLRTEGVAAATRKANDLLSDEKLLLTPAERRQYSNLAEQTIRGFTAARKAELEPVKELAKGYSERLKQGIGLDDPEVDQIATRLAAGGDPVGAMKLLRERATARYLDRFQKADNSGQVAAMEQFIASGSSDAMGIIRGFEGFREGTYWDVNSFRTGYGSDTITLADGTVKTVREGDRVSRADAERDLQRRLNDQEGSIGEAVGERWQSLGGNVRAAVQSVVYNYGVGELSANGDLRVLLDALQEGDTAEIASAVERLAGHNDGVNRNRRMQEAAIIRSTGSMGVDPDVVGKMRTEITSDAKDLWGGIKAGIEEGYTPAPEEVDLLARQLTLINDDDFRQEVSDFFASQAAARDIAMMPPDDAQRIVDALKQEAADGSTVVQQELANTLQGAVDATRKAIDTDILGFGLSNRSLDDLPDVLPGEGVDLAEGMRGREQAAHKMGSMYGRSDVSIFRPSEAEQVVAFLSESSPSDQAQYLGTMAAALSPAALGNALADLSQFGGSGELAAAGILFGKGKQEIAKSILRGVQTLKDNPKYGPKAGASLDTQIAKALPGAIFAFGLESGRQGILDAAMARYADLSAQSGKESREPSLSLLRRVVAEVTGGLVDFNGSPIIAPEYGMSQSRFDALMRNLPADAVNGAVDSSGHPISKDQILRHGRLKMIGDGEYLIEFGAAGYGGYAHSQNGGPFILRLRGGAS